MRRRRQIKDKRENKKTRAKKLNYGSLPGLLSHNSPMLGGQSPAPNAE